MSLVFVGHAGNGDRVGWWPEAHGPLLVVGLDDTDPRPLVDLLRGGGDLPVVGAPARIARRVAHRYRVRLLCGPTAVDGWAHDLVDPTEMWYLPAGGIGSGRAIFYDELDRTWTTLLLPDAGPTRVARPRLALLRH